MSPRGLLGLGILSSALTLYVMTLAPGLTWRNHSADGGELAAAAWTLGVAHPPGYPTYLLLARGFASLLPGLDVAYRFNLFSAVTAALSVLFLFLILDSLLSRLAFQGVSRGVRLLVAGASSLLLAASPVLWSQATVTEVYTLNALFFTAALALSMPLLGRSPGGDGGMVSEGAHWRLPLAAFLVGLGLGNHATLVFLVPVLGWLYIASRHRGVTSALVLAGLFLLGLAVYLYLPLRASANPPINWGMVTTWEGLWWMVTAAPYRDLVFDLSAVEVFQRLAVWARLLVEQFTVVGVGVGLLGAWFLVERLPRALAATAALALVYTAYAIGYKTSDSYVYLIPVFFLFAIWIGVGWLGCLTVLLPRLLPGPRWSPWGRRALLLLLVVLPALNVATRYGDQDLSGDVEAREYASATFGQVGDGALVLAKGDRPIFSLWYQRYVEAPDSQVLVVASPLLQFQWYWESQQRRYQGRWPVGDPGEIEGRLLALAERGLAQGPVYTTYEDRALEKRYRLVPEGGLYRVGQ